MLYTTSSVHRKKVIKYFQHFFFFLLVFYTPSNTESYKRLSKRAIKKIVTFMRIESLHNV